MFSAGILWAKKFIARSYFDIMASITLAEYIYIFYISFRESAVNSLEILFKIVKCSSYLEKKYSLSFARVIEALRTF